MLWASRQPWAEEEGLPLLSLTQVEEQGQPQVAEVVGHTAKLNLLFASA